MACGQQQILLYQKIHLLLAAFKKGSLIEVILSERNMPLYWQSMSNANTLLEAWFNSMKHTVYLMVMDAEIVLWMEAQ